MGSKRKKALFSWPPDGDDADKQFHAEVAAPAAILQALGADIVVGPSAPNKKGGKAKWPSLRAWLEGDTDSGMGGLIGSGASSWNHPQLLMAARGLVFDDWGDAGKLMAMQAGRIPGEGEATWLDGEEPRSTDYDPYRWAAELVFASNRAPAGMRADAREVLKRQMGLALLGAVPWTDVPGFTDRRQWYFGPTLSPVGERSPKTSNPEILGLFGRMMLGRRDLCARDGWACKIADILGFPNFSGEWSWETLPADALRLLGDARVFGEFRFIEYPEGRMVFRPNQFNPNTPSALWSFAGHAEKQQRRGWPFGPGKNRGKNAIRSLGCVIENGEVVHRAQTIDGAVVDDRFRLPTSKPLWLVTIDGQGARFDGGAAPTPAPVDPPPPVTPPAPGIDVEALVAEVAALGAQPDQTEPAVALVRARRWDEAGDAVGAMAVPWKQIGRRDELAQRLRDLS